MAEPSSRTPRRITLIADELAGLRGGGLGTATAFLGLALARMGHRVEVLYAGGEPARPVDPDWERLYKQAGPRVRLLSSGGKRVEPAHFARLRQVGRAPRAEPPGVASTEELAAPPFTPLRPRQPRIALEEALLLL